MNTIRSLPGTVSGDDPHLPEPVRKRWRIVEERSLQKVTILQERIGPERARAIDARLSTLIESHAPVRLRLRALYALVDEAMAFADGLIACHRGCSHCCHIGVPLNQTEAELLGADIHRKPRRVKFRSAAESDEHFAHFDYGYHNPCTFLKDGECSIYPHRPLTCRVHVNMDDDDLLCRLDPDRTPIPVPYLDATTFRAAYLIISGEKLADIRELFPRP